MFGLFKKNTTKEKLNEQYKKLMEEAHALSTRDRTKSDEKTAEAHAVLKELEQLSE